MLLQGAVRTLKVAPKREKVNHKSKIAHQKSNSWHDFHISRVAGYTKKIKPREITYSKPQK